MWCVRDYPLDQRENAPAAAPTDGLRSRTVSVPWGKPRGRPSLAQFVAPLRNQRGRVVFQVARRCAAASPRGASLLACCESAITMCGGVQCLLCEARRCICPIGVFIGRCRFSLACWLPSRLLGRCRRRIRLRLGRIFSSYLSTTWGSPISVAMEARFRRRISTGSPPRDCGSRSFTTAGRCCPRRAALLTGLYSHEAGVGHMIEDRGAPGYMGHLNDRCVTISQALGDAGYFTAMTGKWHVGQNHGVTPSNRGFQRSLNAPVGGFYYGADPRADLYLDGRKLAVDDPTLPKDWYSTDLWTDYGIKFIDEARVAKKPWLLYLAHNAPHFPLQAPQNEMAESRINCNTVSWQGLHRGFGSRGAGGGVR